MVFLLTAAKERSRAIPPGESLSQLFHVGVFMAVLMGVRLGQDEDVAEPQHAEAYKRVVAPWVAVGT